jgi:hypothetical protein
MLPKFFLTNFSCGSWDAQLEKGSGSSTLRGKLRARLFFGSGARGPFAARGAHGEEKYP